MEQIEVGKNFGIMCEGTPAFSAQHAEDRLVGRRPRYQHIARKIEDPSCARLDGQNAGYAQVLQLNLVLDFHS